MMPIIFDYSPLKLVADLAVNLVDRHNDGEFVNNIKDLYVNESSRTCVDAEIDLIRKDPNLLVYEKIDLMNKAEDQHNARDIVQKKQCADIITAGRTKKVVTIMLVSGGLLLTGCAVYAVADKLQNHLVIEPNPQR